MHTPPPEIPPASTNAPTTAPPAPPAPSSRATIIFPALLAPALIALSFLLTRDTLDGQWVVDTGSRRIMTEQMLTRGGPSLNNLSIGASDGTTMRPVDSLTTTAHTNQTNDTSTTFVQHGMRLKDYLFPGAFAQLFLHNDQVFTQYPPSFPWLGATASKLFGRDIGLRLFPLLAAWIAAAAGCAIARRMGARRPWLGGLATLIAVPALPYAFVYWDVLPAAALAMVSLAAMMRALGAGIDPATHATATATKPAARSASYFATVSGLTAGAAFWLREEYLLWCIALLAAATLWSALNARRIVTDAGTPGGLRLSDFVTLLCFGLSAFLVVNNVRLQNEFTIGAPFFSNKWMAQGAQVQDIFLTRTLQYWPCVAYGYFARMAQQIIPSAPQLLGGLAAMTLVALPMIVGVRGRRAWAVLLTVVLGVLALRLYYIWDFSQPMRRLYQTTSLAALLPIAWIGVRGAGGRIRSATPENAAIHFAAWVALLFLAAMVVLSPMVSTIGFHWGPRLLLVSVMILAIVGTVLLERAWHHATESRILLTAALALLALLAVADTAWNLSILREKLTHSAQLQRRLDETDPTQRTPVLLRLDWFALDSSHTWLTRPVVFLHYPQDAAELKKVLTAVDQSTWFSATGESLTTAPKTRQAFILQRPAHMALLDPHWPTIMRNHATTGTVTADPIPLPQIDFFGVEARLLRWQDAP